MKKIFMDTILMTLVCSGIFASGKKENPFLYRQFNSEVRKDARKKPR
jgi:hypothetical protein